MKKLVLATVAALLALCLAACGASGSLPQSSGLAASSAASSSPASAATPAPNVPAVDETGLFLVGEDPIALYDVISVYTADDWLQADEAARTLMARQIMTVLALDEESVEWWAAQKTIEGMVADITRDLEEGWYETPLDSALRLLGTSLRHYAALGLPVEGYPPGEDPRDYVPDEPYEGSGGPYADSGIYPLFGANRPAQVPGLTPFTGGWISEVPDEYGSHIYFVFYEDGAWSRGWGGDDIPSFGTYVVEGDIATLYYMSSDNEKPGMSTSPFGTVAFEGGSLREQSDYAGDGIVYLPDPDAEAA